jgi:hypothetical protein
VETGEYIAGNVTAAETKKQYRRQFGHVEQFLELRLPDSYREGEMIFPIGERDLLAFFNSIITPGFERAKYVGRKSEMPNDIPEPLSNSYVKGYRSAILNMYKTKHIIMDAILKTKLDELLSKLPIFYFLPHFSIKIFNI